MKTKWIFAGVVLTAAVSACSLGPARGVQATALSTSISIGLPEGSLGSNGPVVGVNLYAVNNYTAAVTKADGERTLSYIKNTLHASAVDLVWNLYSPGYYSNSIVTNRKTTLTAANIAILTKIAQGDGLDVEYRPLIFVETKGNNWEGLIEPSNPTKWFDSYYAQNLPYLEMAQKYHINEFVIGTEMKRLSPAKQWKSFLAKSARIFRGQISYAQNQSVYFPPGTDLPPTTLTGVDMYEPLKNASAAASLSRGGGGVRQVLRRDAGIDPGAGALFTRKKIKGWAGAYQEPAPMTLTGPLDPAIQYNWFTAGCEAAKRFHLRAIFFWKVDLADNPAHPASSRIHLGGTAGSGGDRPLREHHQGLTRRVSELIVERSMRMSVTGCGHLGRPMPRAWRRWARGCRG